ncbi:hypothetical protein Mterra_03957 [Calidithermus terrae]|uniref:Uncharacterized protein n=1 Tax=Calidithermus terrae TaxID=1408545 RepID=A0A399DW98_9DEIN|nr:hypothetical protein Mterra_03957 [Calidithermus terrae]
MTPDQRVNTLRAERGPVLRKRAVSRDVEDQVVAPAALGEVLLGVVNDVVRPEGARQVHFLRTAHRRHPCAERLGDLHRERPHAAGGAVDQHLLPGPDPAGVPQPLQRGHGRHRHGRRLLERQARRLQRQGLLLGADVLGQPAEPAAGQVAEHLVPGLEALHVLPHRLDPPRDVGAEDRVLGPEEPEHQPQQARGARQKPPVGRVEGRGVHPDQHLAGLRDGLGHLLELENVGGTVPGIYHRLHLPSPFEHDGSPGASWASCTARRRGCRLSRSHPAIDYRPSASSG